VAQFLIMTQHCNLWQPCDPNI